jgi:hypothetical protein
MATYERCRWMSIRVLTKPEEAKCPYQDHFFLVLCENLATSTMVGNGARTKELINLFARRVEKTKVAATTRNGGARDTTYNTIREPIARIATAVCASVNAPRWISSGHRSCVRTSAKPGHIRIFEGIVHIRTVPVIIDATPDGRVACRVRGIGLCALTTYQPQLIGGDYP